MPAIKRSHSRSRSPVSRYSRSRSTSPGSLLSTQEYDVSPYNSDDSEYNGPLVLTPPPFYNRVWPMIASESQEDYKEKKIATNPKFIIPVRVAMTKCRPLIQAADLEEIYKKRLFHLVKITIVSRIKELLRVQNITCYLRYKAILDIYWKYFPQYTNQNLVEELVSYIKDKMRQDEIRSLDRDGLQYESSDDCSESDKRYVKQRTDQEIAMIFKDTPGSNLNIDTSLSDVSESLDTDSIAQGHPVPEQEEGRRCHSERNNEQWT